MSEHNESRLSTSKTSKILCLFMASALAVLPGCTPSHRHVDKNGDGYCDEDGERITSNTGGSGFYRNYYGNSYNQNSGTQPVNTSTTSHISDGTSAKGGIGSHSSGSGG